MIIKFYAGSGRPRTTCTDGVKKYWLWKIRLLFVGFVKMVALKLLRSIGWVRHDLLGRYPRTVMRLSLDAFWNEFMSLQSGFRTDIINGSMTQKYDTLTLPIADGDDSYTFMIK